jgi:hypothetical protein
LAWLLEVGADLETTAIDHDHCQFRCHHPVGHGEFVRQGQLLEAFDQGITFLDALLADLMDEVFDLFGRNRDA